MAVKLISYTTPSGEMQISGIKNLEDLIAYTARVSNPGNQINNESTNKLLKYCLKNKHWSIFEMVDITLEIETTRDIGRQILRHRSFNFQEFSQRYADVSKELPAYNVREARLQDNKNRQNSIETTDKELQTQWEDKQNDLMLKAMDTYVWAIGKGIAKEVARAVLPEGLTQTRMYMKGSLRSWITYIALREKNGTQKEHMEIAKECKNTIAMIFPTINEAIECVS